MIGDWYDQLINPFCISITLAELPGMPCLGSKVGGKAQALLMPRCRRMMNDLRIFAKFLAVELGMVPTL